MQKKKLYFFILGFALTGYAWVAGNHYLLQADRPTFNVCLFRMATGLPCPSCGTTHSVISISNGNFKAALNENILGYLAALLLLVIPVWIVGDLVLRKESFYTFYGQMEGYLRKKWIAYPAIILILVNWAWNIYKTL
jgi:hypothetical protein